MKLLEYYTEVITTVGLTTTEDNYLSFDGKEKIEYNGLPIAVPTKEHLKNIKELDIGTMEMVLSKHIFNPLSESSSDGINPGMSVLKNKISMFMEVSIETITYYLIRILADPELQKNLPIKLIKFMSYMADNSRKGVRTFTTKDTEKNIAGVFDIKDKLPIVDIEMCENASIDGKTYRHVLDIKLPLYETLNSKSAMKVINKNKNIEGAKVVPSKDLPIIRAVHDYLFDNIDLTFKTNNSAYPTYILYMEAWLTVYGRLNDVLKTLKFIDPDNINRLIVDMSLNKKEISASYLKQFNMELSTIMIKDIEKDNSSNRPKLTGVKKKKVTKVTGNIETNSNVITPPVVNTPATETNVIVTEETNKPMSYIDELKAEMSKTPTPMTYGQPTVYAPPATPYATPTPMYNQQQQPNINPMYQQPMGVNTYPTQIPMGQQPMNPHYPQQQTQQMYPPQQQTGYSMQNIGFR